ncbi:Thioredoxin reductase 1, mitochondrial [Folsomia candida]|uniref:Thioredoxin reductase 1, mitochondrial n=1 Tax=Folsomia candida TaxID=158441 RepID=A0A226DNU5_FOLCA|nr:Thioredoxin reductase 1, mitochondrial [Folsomia candida]
MLLFRQFSTFSSKVILTSSTTTTTCNLPLLQAQQKLLVVTKSTMSSSSPTKGSKYDYDLIVIGGGSGELAASKEAAALGAKVALLDFVPESPQGTTWASLVGENISDANSYGWTSVDTSKSKSVDWPALVQNVQDRIKGTNWTYRVALRDPNVTYINGLGEFVYTNTIKATIKQGKISIHTASNILIANHPGKTLVVGGSYIALETAGFLQGLGIDTTIMVRSILLRGFDQQMADLVGKYMEDECHVKFQVGRVPVSVKEGKPGSSNQRTLIVSSKPTSGAGSVVEEEFNTVMFATGRLFIPPGLNLGPIGVKVDESGFVIAKTNRTKPAFPTFTPTKDRPELTPAAIQAGLLLARDRVVGLHFIGYNAGEVVQGFPVAIRLGMSKND